VARFDDAILREAFSLYNERTKTLEEYILVTFDDSLRNLIPAQDHAVVEANSVDAESGETAFGNVDYVEADSPEASNPTSSITIASTTTVVRITS